jgi:hypothetical protein
MVSEFPPSSDMVELIPLEDAADGVTVFCIICGKHISGPVKYLNQVIVVWRDHRKEEADKKKESHERRTMGG